MEMAEDNPLQVEVTQATFEIAQATQAKRAMQKYADSLKSQVINADTAKDVKKQKADANKILKAVKELKKTKKAYMETEVVAMEQAIDDIFYPVKEAIKELKDGLDGVELDRKAKSKQHIMDTIIEPICTEKGVDPNKISIVDKWLNKTTSQIQITKDVARMADFVKEVDHRNSAFPMNRNHQIAYRDTGEIDKKVHWRQATITYFGDSEDFEMKLREMTNNTNVLDVKFEED